jgi:hypothetical protein
VFIAAECPVCPGFGAAVFLCRLDVQQVFFGCAACGCAWEHPPLQLDSIDRTTRFAPAGFRLATRSDIENLRLGHLVLRECAPDGVLEDFAIEGGFRPTAG